LNNLIYLLMNDDLVVQKILKLLENNKAFVGYAINGGIGTKINVRNTETGKTIQALSINVDSTGEVLVVKDTEDGQYKAVNFKTAEKVSERIIQLRKTKPVDDKKKIDYTDSDIEVFYLFVKLIDTGVPVPTNLKSTWIRKGSSCTQFVGAYERCNYASKETIGGVSYTGLPYKPYETLQACLNDDLGRDAKTPHGSKDENGVNPGWRIYSTKMTLEAEQSLLNALTSHDNEYKTNYKKLFGYGSILECSGAMYVVGWEPVSVRDPVTNIITRSFFRCEFSYLPGYAPDCTLTLQNKGYCDIRGFINSKTPPAGHPDAGGINNNWAYEYGWADLSYDFMYKRHFIPLYVNGQAAGGSFLIFEGLTDDQNPTIPEGYFPWEPGCPSNGQGGPYNGTGGNRFPDGVPPLRKRDMKLSTHRAEIWLGSSKKEEAIKLYELGASDLFSGMYNAFIIRSEETRVDIENRLNRGPSFTPTQEDIFKHTKFYENWNKNIIDLDIDPRVWVYVMDNKPAADSQNGHHNYFTDPRNPSLQLMIDNLYNRTINLSIIDSKTQIVHLKLGLLPRSTLSNTDCKGVNSGVFVTANDQLSSQSWEYQKYVTITVKNWSVTSTKNTLDTQLLTNENSWNKDYIERKYFTSFGGFQTNNQLRDVADNILLRHDSNTSLEKIITDNHFEQFNYSLQKIVVGSTLYGGYLYFSGLLAAKRTDYYSFARFYALSSRSWWELWGKATYNKATKRLSSIVGYEKNYYQIVRSFQLGLGLNYTGHSSGGLSVGNAVRVETYFDYLPNLEKVFLPSPIKIERNKQRLGASVVDLSDRKEVLDKIGTLFYFSERATNWTIDVLSDKLRDIEFNRPFLSNDYYAYGYSSELITNATNLQSNLTSYFNTKRINTRQWFNNLWAQFIYDTNILVDIDSYKEVEFTLPTNPSQYKKFALFPDAKNNEYNFSTIEYSPVTLNTVLSPGKLEIASKQVPIKKPTNVDLNPNYSFLLYLYPYVTITKKTKEI
jgi:hypothetical protein